MTNAAMDNDVLLKAVSYGIFDSLLAVLPACKYGVLGTARFVVPKYLKRRPPRRYEQARAELEQVLAHLDVLEPTAGEVALAAALEFEAQRQQLSLHGGECTLLAILHERGLLNFLTGDKAAILAIGRIALPGGMERSRFERKIICFERAILALLDREGDAFRQVICAEPEVDMALRLSFSCSSPGVSSASWREGLQSEIRHLNEQVPNLLID
ncbi:hypothetical protein KK141_17290 [Dyella sp. LX-66]|uniref:hypothetical protein n=1 Tax=unclassified Dyella TaxID=2634549 RepID=UPI001BDFC9E4|nr:MULTISPECIES: hypothetical protein [unclassified Dyella]MBT2117789.1 hypothetical protein [Dyella sp. LX-1]MBT2141304.1 hypothetical protein [Dyella sp. LX-66]